MTGFLLTLLVGMALGVIAVFAVLSRWADTERGRRARALCNAERRVHDVRIAALTQLADVAEESTELNRVVRHWAE